MPWRIFLGSTKHLNAQDYHKPCWPSSALEERGWEQLASREEGHQAASLKVVFAAVHTTNQQLSSFLPHLIPVKEKLHWSFVKNNSMEDCIQDHCNKEERMNSTLLK